MVTIVKGEDKTFTLQFMTPTARMTLVGVTAAEMRLPHNNGTGVISETLAAGAITVTDAANGELTVTVDKTNSALLKLGPISGEIILDYGSTRKIFQLKDQFVVESRLLP